MGLPEEVTNATDTTHPGSHIAPTASVGAACPGGRGCGGRGAALGVLSRHTAQCSTLFVVRTSHNRNGEELQTSASLCRAVGSGAADGNRVR